MLKKALLAVVLLPLFLSSNFVTAASKDDLAQKFSEAQHLSSQGNIAQAITAYQALILENPLLPEAYNNLAVLYLKQNNTKQAKYILEQGLHAHNGYGVLYESLTAINIAMAKEAYSKALQIDLKPANIEIASLSLKDNKAQIKNTIVISQVETPIKHKAVVTKKIVQSVGEVSRNNRVVEKEKKIQKKQEPKKQLSKNSATKIKSTKEIEKTLLAWSAAWSAQAVDMYLSFYHNQYKPMNGLTQKGWVQSRRYRLKKPRWINIKLSNIVFKQKTNKQAVVNFKQLYQSNSFRDVSQKQMVLLYTEQGWQIFREKSI